MASGPERDRLFTEPMEGLSLQKALQLAENIRCAREGSRHGGAPGPAALEVHKLAATARGRGAPVGGEPRPRWGPAAPPGSSRSAERCDVCGYVGHLGKKCRFRNAVCKICGKKGHLQRVCENSNTGNQHFLQCCSDDDDGKQLIFNIRSVRGEPMQESVTVDDVSLTFEIDTGSAVTAISDDIYNKYFIKHPLCESRKILQSYNGASLETLGTISLPFCFRSQTEIINVFVVKNGGPPLLGRDFIAKFKLQICPINTCQINESDLNFTEKYPKLFSEQLGCCKGVEVKLNLKPESSPIYIKARSVPFALRPKLDEEIDRLVGLGIIESVPFSDYASPVVPVLRRDGKIRLCADYSATLNKQLLVDKYPLPKVEELFAKLHGGVQFTKLDLSGAYNQLLLNKDSRDLTCIHTHKGLYRYTRLVFGLSSAPAIFQRTLENILIAPDESSESSLVQEGVLQFLDDILITGKTRSEHLARLQEVFRRLENAGLVLKKDKCHFFQDSVSYLGFVIDKNGLHKCPEKVKSILNAKKPENVTDLKSFLGMVNYYRTFIKNASSILAPLHELLQKNVTWNWTSDHENAFNSVKKCLSSDNILAHLNQDARIILTVDASPWGLGAILSQIDKDGVERPVSYASRSLNPAERQYSQIQKEATAIIFGVRKYHQYLYGRSEPFILRTDHKPLLSIFHPEKSIPEVSANRLQRYALFLSAYNYKIEYVNSASNCADYLSRSMAPRSADAYDERSTFSCNKQLGKPVPSQAGRGHSLIDEACYVNFVFDADSELISINDLKTATESDKILMQVAKFTLSGWPLGSVVKELRPYYGCRLELSVEKGVIMRGSKLVIPEGFRQVILRELHNGHLGVCKMTTQARSRFWWPGMAADVAAAVAACAVCARLRPAPPRAQLTPWPYPPEPWHRVHLDFLGPMNNKMFLIIVDAYSKWVEVYDVSSGYGSKVVIQILCELMARYGLINTLCTDNGTTFVSSEFELFCSRNGIKHLTSPAYNPASNGQAESYVKIVKRALKAIIMSGKSSHLNVKLNEFLFNYRNSVHSSTNKSPAQILFGRQLRCRLDLLNPQISSPSDTTLAETVKVNQSLQAKYYKGKRNIDFNINDIVLVKIHQNGKSIWTNGVINKKIGRSAYLVSLTGYDYRIVKRHKNQIYESKGEMEVSPSPTATGPSHGGADRGPSLQPSQHDSTSADWLTPALSSAPVTSADPPAEACSQTIPEMVHDVDPVQLPDVRQGVTADPEEWADCQEATPAPPPPPPPVAAPEPAEGEPALVTRAVPRIPRYNLRPHKPVNYKD
ncbi:hypothetical protein JYU34_022039 [Plutella xylostella]|uniref:RNA-directed DNA polymerase n=1 Tax=Plutella xylostella TaxID=51655 RepID=A0ABQ7PQ74_PLUXY|nr:hypothetical protein JYU34_022039 [Plutella xylostella]